MIVVAALAVVITLVLGLGVMALCKQIDPESGRSQYGYRSRDELYRVSWAEFIIGGLIMSLLFVPLVLGVGSKLSVDNIVSYEQFVNGVETVAGDSATVCHPGSSGSSKSSGYSNCDYSYNSGQTYTYQESHTRQKCSTDSKGKQSCTTETYTTDETGYIYYPYVKVEHRYYIDSSMGKAGSSRYDFAGVFADANPEPYSDRSAVPADLPRGAPADWIDAKRHLDAGDPRPVTKVSSYDNYILASGDEILNTYSSQIESYKSAGLLPDPAKNMMSDPISGSSDSQAAKVAFVGVSVPNEVDWQLSAMRFNAAFGMKLQGDLHVVVVDTAQVPSSDAEMYTKALKAYWQSPAFEKRAIAKNAVIVVIGAANGKVDWARATTGMPFGNEEMAQWVQDWLPGKSLDPRAIFGAPVTTIKPGISSDDFTNDDYTVTLSSPRGSLEEIMFEKAPFKRARMSCDDGTCVGYKDLLDKIDPTTGQKVFMLVVVGFIALIVWAIMAFTSVFDRIAAAAMYAVRSNKRKQ